jgi:hypothetical protein
MRAKMRVWVGLGPYLLVDLDLGPGALLNGHDGLSPAPDHLAHKGLGAFHHLVVREREEREDEGRERR